MIAKNEKTRSISSKNIVTTLSFFRGIDQEKNTGQLPSNFADECKNFAFENDKLVSTPGWEIIKMYDNTYIEPLTDIGGGRLFAPKIVYDMFNNSIFLYSHDKGLEMRSSNLSKEKWERFPYQGIAQSCCYYRYNGLDYAFLSSTHGMYYIVDGGGFSMVLTQKHIKKILSHNERIFAVVKEPMKPNSLWFSDIFNPLEWDTSLDGGGYIDVDYSYGEIREIEGIGEYLYIFCDFGICRLTCFAGQENFELKKVCSLPFKMLENGIGKIKEKIVFATEKNLCIFDGNSYVKLDIQLDKYLEDSFIKKVLARDEKIYICTNNQDTTKNVIIVYDLSNNTFHIMSGWQIDDITLVEGKRWSGIAGKSWLDERLVKLSDNQENFIIPVERVWKTSDIDLGLYSGEKIIKEIEYKVTSECELVIECDKIEHNFKLLPNKNKIKINVKGKKFSFKILSNTPKVEIYPIKIKIGVKSGDN